MPILITRTTVVPVWLLASAFIVAFSAPSATAAAALLLLSCGLAAAAVLLLGANAAKPAFVHRPHTIDVRAALAAPEPSADRRLSWPNSGFRNIGRGTKGG